MWENVEGPLLVANMVSDLIMDVGVHKGEDTEFYLKKGFRVVGIEGYPPLYEAAQSRLKSYIDNGQLRLLNVAVAEKNGPVDFYANLDLTVWGTTVAEWAERNERLGTRSAKLVVEGRRFDEIVREFGVPYYLKVDIEGSDLLCLRALFSFRERPQYISLESEKVKWSGLLEEFVTLRNLGYQRFKVVAQHEVDSQVCPYPAREGKFIQHRFPAGSSGLFGEEAPGEWLNEVQALKVYQPIFRRYQLFGDDGLMRRTWLRRAVTRLLRPKVGWYDTHAALTTEALLE